MGRFSCFFKMIPAFVLCCSFAGNAYAQTHIADSLVSLGDSLHRAYRFAEAHGTYLEALGHMSQRDSTDSSAVFSVNERILMAENGRNMARFARKPKVIDRRRFSLEDFFLYYPLEDRSWRSIPNQLDSSASDGLVRALYAPEWDDAILFSAPDGKGVRNICLTEFEDTVWTAPVLAGEAVTSGSGEIYPMFSPDRKTMYFASRGFYGIGGYDLYMSEWDAEKGEWAAPRNMGFPYSSPADDFLFVNSEDGQYSLFASNRECSRDSVFVYVLEYEEYPVHVPVEEPDSLLALSRLEPLRSKAPRRDETDFPDNDLTRKYMERMARVRSLRDSISDLSFSLEELRTEYAFGNDAEERSAITDRILRLESELPRLQDVLDRANVELRDVEMEFLKKGVFIDPDLGDDSESEDSPMDGYEFRRRSAGAPLDIEVASPEEKFDYTFMVLEEGRLAEEQSLPQGVVYQIQMYGSAKKAAVKDLRGLSPVYESRSPSGLYIYRAGRFASFAQAAASVEAVRRQGFRSAYVTACIDGKDVPVSKARAIEASRSSAPLLYQVRIEPVSGELDPSLAAGIVERASGKDIARTETEEGIVIFMAGPFNDKAAADALAAFVSESSDCDVSVELFGSELTNK